MATKPEILDHLRNRLANGPGKRGPRRGTALLHTKIPDLDRVLPGGGIEPGSLVEILDPRSGSGAESLAALMSRSACIQRPTVVVLDRERQFYPPALAVWGLAIDQLVVVHPTNDRDEFWAADQALRSRGVAAVWLRLDWLKPHDFRRLHLAAEAGGTLGLLLRPVRVRGEPTWADLQLFVEPRPSTRGRRVRVEVTRCRGGMSGHTVDIELDEAAGLGEMP